MVSIPDSFAAWQPYSPSSPTPALVADAGVRNSQNGCAVVAVVRRPQIGRRYSQTFAIFEPMSFGRGSSVDAAREFCRLTFVHFDVDQRAREVGRFGLLGFCG
uniref:Uncharacterized protein n=1 Tax=Romanomermis culicivorax TaxID=13658 RepID=A0A915JMT0_ROMCU